MAIRIKNIKCQSVSKVLDCLSYNIRTMDSDFDQTLQVGIANYS